MFLLKKSYKNHCQNDELGHHQKSLQMKDGLSKYCTQDKYFPRHPWGDWNVFQMQARTHRCLPHPIKRPQPPSSPITVIIRNGTRTEVESSEHTEVGPIALWLLSEVALCQQREIIRKRMGVGLRDRRGNSIWGLQVPHSSGSFEAKGLHRPLRMDFTDAEEKQPYKEELSEWIKADSTLRR